MNLIESLTYLKHKNYIIESTGVREASRDEYEYSFNKVVENEINMYYKDKPESEQAIAYNELMNDMDDVWSKKVHAYTTDGTDSLVLTPNKDGSNYVYLWYIDPEKRGNNSLAMFKQAVIDSPAGLSFHTNKNNKLARAAVRYGFKEYPSSHPNEIFMSNKEGIDGNEWWEDSEIERT